MSSIQETDRAAQAIADQTGAPRVSLAMIEAAISERFDVMANDAAAMAAGTEFPSHSSVEALKAFSLCILVMKNGFVVVGKSAPAAPENYNAELGKRFAYEDAVRQLWPLMGFALREKLASASE